MIISHPAPNPFPAAKEPDGILIWKSMHASVPFQDTPSFFHRLVHPIDNCGSHGWIFASEVQGKIASGSGPADLNLLSS